MLRNFNSLGKETFDLLIIGGGITGACIAWDASLRGLRVALVEAKDFSHATSSATSKMVHGGLRYLKNFELSLVRESLRERRIWESNAPHLVDPLPFLAPTYGYGMQSRFVMGLGLTFYDLLSYDRNRLDDSDKHLPSHRYFPRAQALAMAPPLEPEGLTGAMLYYDCQMYAPERIGLECVLGARDHGAVIVNYAKAVELTKADGAITGAVVEDGLTGNKLEVRASLTINASGPWADDLAALAGESQPSVRLIRSKGIHLITRKLLHYYALAVFAEHEHFLVLPWRGHTILGTTDTPFDGDPADVRVTEADITGLLATVNRGLPGAHLKRSDVLKAYVGLRPLVDERAPGTSEGDASYDASRKAELVDHTAINGPNGFISAVGGKWTTSRHMAERVVDLAVRKLGRSAISCTTETEPLRGGNVGRFRDFTDKSVKRYPDLPVQVIRHLTRTYGAKLNHLMEEAGNATQSLSPHAHDIGGQVIHAVRHELAQSLADVIFRRTGLGTMCHPGAEALARAAKLMGEELGWNEAEQSRQIEDVETELARSHAVEPQLT